MKKNKALFAISSLWLWHATRTLVVIHMYLLKDYEIDIISHWNALNYLKQELVEKKVNFIELIDYPHLERWNWFKFYIYLLIDLIKTKKLIETENKFIKEIESNYDFIFSDWKYGIYSKQIPSFLMSHQLSFIMPKWLSIFQNISDYFNKKYFKNFTKVFIPDYIDLSKSLSWKLSHTKMVNDLNHIYIWVLSSFYDNEETIKNFDKNKKIDYLFIISWYLIENKQNFIDKLLEEAKELDWKKVFVLWDTNKNYIKELENNITIYANVSWKLRLDFFRNAWVIVSRSWYTTIMDCVELDKKAIFFPTKNQTEQEYLWYFLDKNKYFVIGNDNSRLLDLVANLEYIHWFNTINKTKQALQLIEKEIDKYIITT